MDLIYDFDLTYRYVSPLKSNQAVLHNITSNGSNMAVLITSPSFDDDDMLLLLLVESDSSSSSSLLVVEVGISIPDSVVVVPIPPTPDCCNSD